MKNIASLYIPDCWDFSDVRDVFKVFFLSFSLLPDGKDWKEPLTL